MARRPAKSIESVPEEPSGPQPKTTFDLIGHAAAEQSILDSWNAGKLHHAWLVTGPRGIGKATFAYRVARFLLSGPPAPGDGLFGPEPVNSLAVDQHDPASVLAGNGAHPGFQLLVRTVNSKTGKMRTEIVVDQVRELADFFGLSRDGDWRLIIIDPAEELNRNAANALLKILEEPPANCCFILVSHAPGKLLPTIKSRCRKLELSELDDSQVATVLRMHGEDCTSEILALANGSPGRALRLASLDMAPLIIAVDKALADQLSLVAQVAVAEALAVKDSQPRFEAFLELAPQRMADRLRLAALAHKPVLEPAFSLWEKARELAAQTLAINLDPKLVVFDLLGTARQISRYL
jgi:DNA polymerase III subunit delta'